MKYTIRFSLIVAACTAAVLFAIPPLASAQIIPNWKAPAAKHGGTPILPPDLGDANPPPQRCVVTRYGIRCTV